jgi:site-specific recombinase XerD
MFQSKENISYHSKKNQVIAILWCKINIFAPRNLILIIMATVQAFIRTSKKKTDEVNIRFRLRDGRNIQLFHTSELLVNPDVWDSKEQSVKKRIVFNESVRLRINKAVNDRKALILQIYAKETDKAGFSSEKLETAIDRSINPERYRTETTIDTLFKFTERFIEEAPLRKDVHTGRLLTPNNIRQYKAAEKHLKAYAAIVRRNDFKFGEIDRSFYEGFVSYLQKGIPMTDDRGEPEYDSTGRPKMIKESFTANSVGKQVKVLKVMLNEASRQGYNTTSYYKGFHVFTEDTDSIYLNERELEQLKNRDFSGTLYLDRVRDWFLLLSWTGCRFSDLEKVGETDIKDGFITFRQQKTNTKVTIPLHPVVREILKKYDYSLPEPISNQHFNEYIKEAARHAGIDTPETVTQTRGGRLVTEQYPKWQLVTSHTGRRSFCTNMYKRGLPTLMIMSISGHKTEKSFLRYIKVRQEEHAEMMRKAWENMYK